MLFHFQIRINAHELGPRTVGGGNADTALLQTQLDQSFSDRPAIMAMLSAAHVGD